MNKQQTELYQRIQVFSQDNPDAKFSFSKRLAKENGWTEHYTQRVITEYKKFAFLAVAAGHPVTPSDQIDRVWHLHLTYTRSYWEEFCLKVLQMPLHHEPTKGGGSERDKFNDWYTKTLASYEHFFGYAPPADIWPPLHIRFSHGDRFLRVNLQQNWIIPKPSLDKLPRIDWNQPAIWALLFIIGLGVTSCASSVRSQTIPNPLNLTGPEFLALYLVLGIAAIILANILRDCLRWAYGNSAVELDVYETAYLSAGKDRTVDTAIAILAQRGYVQPQPKQRTLVLTTTLEQIDHPFERAVAAAIETDGNISQVRASAVVSGTVDRIRDRLEQLELLLNQKQAAIAGMFSAIPIFALLGLGISKIVVGVFRGKPVGFLVFLCIITAFIGLGFWFVSPLRSLLGDRVLANIRTRLGRSTVVSNTDPQLPIAFALLGAGVLAGSTLADLQQVFIPPATASDGGDGGGDGGGCGGGCGGCGG